MLSDIFFWRGSFKRLFQKTEEMLESAAAESFDPNDASVGDMTVSTNIIPLLQLFAQSAVIVAIASDVRASG